MVVDEVVVDDRFGAVLLLVDVVAPALSSLVIRVDVVVASARSISEPHEAITSEKAVARAVNVTARLQMFGRIRKTRTLRKSRRVHPLGR